MTMRAGRNRTQNAKQSERKKDSFFSSAFCREILIFLWFWTVAPGSRAIPLKKKKTSSDGWKKWRGVKYCKQIRWKQLGGETHAVLVFGANVKRKMTQARLNLFGIFGCSLTHSARSWKEFWSNVLYVSGAQYFKYTAIKYIPFFLRGISYSEVSALFFW